MGREPMADGNAMSMWRDRQGAVRMWVPRHVIAMDGEQTFYDPVDFSQGQPNIAPTPDSSAARRV